MDSFRLPAPLVCSLLALAPLACSNEGGQEGAGTSETNAGTTGADTETGTETSTGDGDGDGGPLEPDPVVDWPNLPCDSLVPEYCMFPYPSNVFTVADAGTDTGRRLAHVSESLPTKGADVLAEPFNVADGFSPGLAPMTYLAGATTTGLPTWQNLEASLTDDSPTVLIHAETGERVAHFAEIDVSLAGATENALMIRPVTRLEDNTRYIVAIREVVDQSGEPIPASPGFAALRDISETEDPDIEARRPLYTDIFARLSDAGVERESLQIAWDFTTASLESTTGDLIHMRDAAMALYTPEAGPQYTILDVDEEWASEDIAYRIEGTIEVPLFLDNPDPGGRIVYGDDGLPEVQGTAEFEFLMMIPNSALDEPAPLVQYGHGLLGSKDQVGSGHLRTWANEYNYIIFGVDWKGMASDDTLNIAQMLSTGEIHRFLDVTDRLQQGMINFLVATRWARDSMGQDPMFGALIDPSQVYYYGISQGGIFGGTFMAITQDIERGCVGVFGQPYNLLLNRSVDFDQYFSLLQLGFGDSRDLQMILALIQGLWDHAEPTGYAHKVQADLFPDTPEHQLLMRAALGDHQVSTLGAHIGARAVGATHLDSGIREVWGLAPVELEMQGSAYVEYAFGLPEDPLENVPQTACEDPHSELRKLDSARMQLDRFFQDGVIENFCPEGVCDYPELSGCP